MITPKKEFHDALRILNRYYDELAKQMADEIIQHAEEFESPGIGQAESVIEKYRTLSPTAQREVESFIEFKRRQEEGGWDSDEGDGEGGDV